MLKIIILKKKSCYILKSSFIHDYSRTYAEDYIVLKWKSRFTFWLNVTKIIDYIKKLFK